MKLKIDFWGNDNVGYPFVEIAKSIWIKFSSKMSLRIV